MFTLCKENGRTSIILCVEFVANRFKQILFKNLNLNHVTVQVDKGGYFAFNVEKMDHCCCTGVTNS
jgi:hypothetical protein